MAYNEFLLCFVSQSSGVVRGRRTCPAEWKLCGARDFCLLYGYTVWSLWSCWDVWATLRRTGGMVQAIDEFGTRKPGQYQGRVLPFSLWRWSQYWCTSVHGAEPSLWIPRSMHSGLVAKIASKDEMKSSHVWVQNWKQNQLQLYSTRSPKD